MKEPERERDTARARDSESDSESDGDRDRHCTWCGPQVVPEYDVRPRSIEIPYKFVRERGGAVVPLPSSIIF